MSKLQRIKRSNGSLVFSVNIPLEVIEDIGWEKGQELLLEVKKIDDKNVLIIFKSEDEINELVETNG